MQVAAKPLVLGSSGASWVFGHVHCYSGAAGSGPGFGRVRGWAVVNEHVDSDVAAVCIILGCSTGETGAGWGGLSCLGGLLDHHLGFLM